MPSDPSITLGENARRGAARPGETDSGSLIISMRAGAVRQAADEAALLQRRDQPVNAGLGPQIERVLHLVEGRRHAGLLQPLVDEDSSSYCFRVSTFPRFRSPKPAPRNKT